MAEISKYNNNKVDGFDSEAERDFSLLLDEMKVSYEMQKEYLLQEKFELNGKKYRPIKYIADFHLYKLDIVIDIKGFKTADFKLKKKLFEDRYKKELILLTACPKKYEDKKTGLNFEGWIEVDELHKLRKEEKKKKPKLRESTQNLLDFHNNALKRLRRALEDIKQVHIDYGWREDRPILVELKEDIKEIEKMRKIIKDKNN